MHVYQITVFMRMHRTANCTVVVCHHEQLPQQQQPNTSSNVTTAECQTSRTSMEQGWYGTNECRETTTAREPENRTAAARAAAAQEHYGCVWI